LPTGFRKEIKFIGGLWFNLKGLSLLRVKNEFPCLALQFAAHPASICSSRGGGFFSSLSLTTQEAKV
jgi:hypothetical protein